MYDCYINAETVKLRQDVWPYSRKVLCNILYPCKNFATEKTVSVLSSFVLSFKLVIGYWRPVKEINLNIIMPYRGNKLPKSRKTYSLRKRILLYWYTVFRPTILFCNLPSPDYYFFRLAMKGKICKTPKLKTKQFYSQHIAMVRCLHSRKKLNCTIFLIPYPKLWENTGKSSCEWKKTLNRECERKILKTHSLMNNKLASRVPCFSYNLNGFCSSQSLNYE